MAAYALWCVAAAVAFAVWYLWASRSLSPDEIRDFALRKRIVAAEAAFPFTNRFITADPSVKRSMPAQGGLWRLDEPLSDFPSIAAALLKGKKHEWLIVALARGGRVAVAWMNKGEDRTSVYSGLQTRSLDYLVGEYNADTVIDIHNHPNPDPHYGSVWTASPQDRTSIDLLGKHLTARGLSLFAFVAERGTHYAYGCWLPQSVLPLDRYDSEVRSRAGTSRLVNLRLRRENGRPSRLATLLLGCPSSHNLGIGPDQTGATDLLGRRPVAGEERPPSAPLDDEPSSDGELVPVVSSYLHSIGYDSADRILTVVFRDGSRYQYHDVPRMEYFGLMAATSKGRYFRQRISSGPYKYTRFY